MGFGDEVRSKPILHSKRPTAFASQSMTNHFLTRTATQLRPIVRPIGDQSHLNMQTWNPPLSG